MNRRLLALGLLALLTGLAGCVGPFGESAIPPSELAEPADYDWDVGANATYTITTNGTYRAVYRLAPSEDENDGPPTDGNDTATNGTTHDGGRTLELHHRDGLGQRRPLEITSLRYRYPNGTIRNGSTLTARTGNQRTTIQLPAGEGMVAYTARSQPKRFETVVHVEGSHVVALPRNRRVRNRLFGHVAPPTDARNWTADDRRSLRWESVGAEQLSVRYYRPRDVTLFAGIVGAAVILALLAAGYVYREIRQLRADHEALDRLEHDDSGKNPPPGLR